VVVVVVVVVVVDVLACVVSGVVKCQVVVFSGPTRSGQVKFKSGIGDR